MKKILRLYNRPVLWMATGLHAAWGCMLVLDPPTGKISPLFPFANRYTGAIALVFLASAVMSGVALMVDYEKGPSLGTFFALLPQMSLLIASAISVSYFACVGHYGDGVPRDHLFILADQFPEILLAIFYPLGLLQMHAELIPGKTPKVLP